MISYANSREDRGVCDRCGKDVDLQSDPPCPHSICVCDTCERAEVCLSCALVEIADLYAIVSRVQRLRDHWRETGYYGSPGDVRKQYDQLARTLTKALEGETGSE